eukprot:m.42137 g.42137  ORF g.42137 m.42137 type:complete len:64 (+) comp14396_c0_seq2:556-747(+)
MKWSACRRIASSLPLMWSSFGARSVAGSKESRLEGACGSSTETHQLARGCDICAALPHILRYL